MINAWLKMINRKQCTIAWYVDGNKLSHVDDNVVMEVLDIIKQHFGDVERSRGNKHSFLGIYIESNDNKTVSIL